MQSYIVSEPNIHLILHNTLAGASILVMLCLIVFLLCNNPRKTVNITLSLTALAVIIFELSHILGVSTHDPELSRLMFMGNISVIFISVFNYHCVITVLNKNNRKFILYVIYILGILIAALYILFPNTFILESIPKMYFPNYYVAGNLYHYIWILFQILIPSMFIYELISSYIKENDPKENNRIKYLTFSLMLGWLFGSISTLLVYNIPIDPMYGIYFPILFCLPFTYAVVNYDLLDIHIIAKRAFYYSVLVGICAMILIFLNFLNKWVEEIVPTIPPWVVPFFSALFAVAVGIAIWRRLRENDILKYDFISRTMHDLRTPLTHIRLATGELEDTSLNDTQRTSLDYIEKANNRLIELTNLVKMDQMSL